MQVEVGVGGKTPRDRRAVGETGLAHDGLLQVSVVTPVRVEVAGRAGRAPLRPCAGRWWSVGGAPENAHPARGARSDPEGNARRGQHGVALVERVSVVVAPLADRHAVGQFGHAVLRPEIMSPHISMSCPASSGRARSVATQARKSSIRVCGSSHASSRPTCTRRLAKRGSNSANSPRHELERARVRGLESHRGTTDPVRVGEAVPFDRQLPVLLVSQPPVHVAQAVLVRHQLDVARCSRRRAP